MEISNAVIFFLIFLFYEKTLLALSSVLLMDSACQMSSVNNRRLCRFFRSLYKKLFHTVVWSGKAPFVERKEQSIPSKSVQNDESWADVWYWALWTWMLSFSVYSVVSHCLTSSSMISLWLLTEGALMPLVTFHQSSKMNSSEKQNFCLSYCKKGADRNFWCWYVGLFWISRTLQHADDRTCGFNSVITTPVLPL